MTKKDKKIICCIVLAVVVVTVWFFYNFGGNLLKPVAIRQIKNAAGARIDIEDVRFRLSGKVQLKGVHIGPLIKQKPDNAVLTAGSLDISFSPLSILFFNPRIKQVRISDFVINAQYNNDRKEWNLAGLKLPAGGKSKSVPKFRFKNGRIKFTQIDSGRETKTVNCIIDSGVTDFERKENKTVFTLKQGSRGREYEGIITAAWTAGPDLQINIDGRLPELETYLFGSRVNINRFDLDISSDGNSVVFERANIKVGPETVIDVNGTIRDLTDDPAFTFGVKMQDLTVRKEPQDNCFAHGSGIFAKFIPLLQIFFENFNPQGLLDLDVVLKGSAAQLAKTKCDGFLNCKDISIRYFEFPYLVEHLAGRIDVTETSMNIKDAKAAHGDVDIVMNGFCDGFGKDMNSKIVLSSGNMILDNDLYAALLEHHKKLWYIFSPAGVVSGDFIYTAKPPNFRKMQLYADLLDVSIMCQYFPYAVRGITGKIAVDGDLIELTDVLSRTDGGQIRMDGKITDANTAGPKYNFDINARDIAIDRNLINAFPASQKKFFNTFDITGAGDADISIRSVNDPNMPVDYLAELNIRADSIKHDILVEPLTDAVIEANLTPTAFNIEKFRADFAHSRVDAAGTVWTGADSLPSGYCMHIKALDLAVNSDMVEPILGASPAKILDDFRFDGLVNLGATVAKNSRIDCPALEVSVDCLSDTAVLPGINLPLKDITGTITLKPDTIEFLSLSATPHSADTSAAANGRVTLEGKMTMAENKIDTADLQLAAKDINFDDTVSAALGKAGRYYDELDVEGQFDLNFDKVKLFRASDGQQKISIDGSAALKGCSLGRAKSVSGMYALCDVDVAYKLGGGLERCKLFFDMQNLSVMDRPVTDFRLPIVFDPCEKRVIVENFIADFLGGKISGNASVESDSEGRFADYRLDMALSRVDTQALVAPEQLPSTDSGRTHSELHVHGNLRRPEATIGRFIAEARGIKPKAGGIISRVRAAIYETVKKDMALDNVTIESVIKGRELEITQLDIFGPTASLRGDGTYYLAQDRIDIRLTAYGGAGKSEPGFIESLTAGFGPAVIYVYITGPLEEPKVSVEALPIIRNSLDLMEK